MRISGKENKEQWERLIVNYLNQKRDDDKKVFLARSEQLVGIAILIFVRQDLVGDVNNIQFEIVKLGINGLAGNKGAICARFDVKGSSFCFVCTHLAAGETKYEERLKDIDDTFNVRFRVPNCPTIMHHDYVFFFLEI